MEQQARASIYSPPCSLSWIMDVVGSKDGRFPKRQMPPRPDNTTPARSRFAMPAPLAMPMRLFPQRT